MARNRTSPLEDIMMIASKLPWWACLLLAVLSYAVLHVIATRPIMPSTITPGQVGDAAARGMLTALAIFGQYIMAFAFIMAALVSGVTELKNKKRSYAGGFAITRNNEPVVDHPKSRTQLGTVDPRIQIPPTSPMPDDFVPDSISKPLPPKEFPAVWTESILQTIEWKRFEIVTKEYLNLIGYEASETNVGADGGVDIRVTKPGNNAFQGIVQCKAWNVYKVGVKPVRELFGVMAAENITYGMLITSGIFTSEAEKFAKGKVVLISGWKFLENIRKLPEEKRQRLLEVAMEGDYKTPTCPQCDIKMTLREGKSGKFWGCVRYPRCRQTLVYKEA